jgi:hypothetical protein
MHNQYRAQYVLIEEIASIVAFLSQIPLICIAKCGKHIAIVIYVSVAISFKKNTLLP